MYICGEAAVLPSMCVQSAHTPFCSSKGASEPCCCCYADAILAFRNRFDNLRILFSIGGDGEVWQEQPDCGAWSDAALASIESIIAQYNLDGRCNALLDGDLGALL